MNSESIKYLRKGLEIADDCLGKCNVLRLELNVHQPSQDVMDMLLTKDYLKLCFNSADDPDDDILVFHNSKDKYSHNGDIRMTCFLSLIPEVLEYVRKHKKVLALIEKIKQRKEVKK